MEPHPGQGRVLGVVAAGGALGALGRFGVGLLLPPTAGAFPVGTFLINAVGGLLIGAVIVIGTEWTDVHPLLRPFLATGILGGFTTFSTYAVDADQLLAAGRVGTAGAYVAGTLITTVAATWAGMALARTARPGGSR